eukprot:g27029.t1
MLLPQMSADISIEASQMLTSGPAKGQMSKMAAAIKSRIRESSRAVVLATGSRQISTATKAIVQAGRFLREDQGFSGKDVKMPSIAVMPRMHEFAPKTGHQDFRTPRFALRTALSCNAGFTSRSSYLFRCLRDFRCCQDTKHLSGTWIDRRWNLLGDLRFRLYDACGGESLGFTSRVPESSESLTVSVQMFGGLGLAGYVSKSSAFQYHWYDTPLFYWSDGWAGTGGDIVAFQGDVYPGASVTGQFDIRIGGARCITNQETMPLSSRRRGSLKQVRCQLPDDELLPSGHYNVTVAVGSLDREDGDCPNALCFPYTEEQAGTRYGYGMAAIVPPSSRTGQLYHYTIYPQVTSIEPTEGGWYGGNNLTLHGTSFAVELYANAVTVGGQPCEVLEASLNKLVCRVGSWQGAARKGHSMRGLRNAGYSSRRRLSYGISSVPAEEARELLYQNFYKGSLDALDSEFPGDMDTLGDHRMRELTGYFVPPLTASYSFYICGPSTAHASTHNGIKLVSNERRKNLLATVEDGVQYAETFKAACKRKYGNMCRAWRILLNPGGNGRVSFVPFCNAARSMGFVNVSTLWRHLDVKSSGFITLDNWDPHAICRSEFGGLSEAFRFGMNKSGSGACYRPEFDQFLADFEFAGDNQVLWDALDKDGGGFITVDELHFLSRWEGQRFRSVQVERDFNLGLARNGIKANAQSL